MTRWLWVLLGAGILIGLGVLFWSTSNQINTPPTAQAPASAPQSAAQAPASAPQPAAQAAAPAPQPAAQAPAPAPQSAAQAQAPAPQPAAQAPAPAPQSAAQAQAPAPQPAAQAPAPAPQSAAQAQAPAPQSAAQAQAPAPQPAAQAPAPRPQPETDATTQAADLESLVNEKAKSELASLKPGFSAKDLIAALNDSVTNFPSGSAEVPATTAAFLQKAADDLRQLPAGHVLEIAGYTDNTGNPAENIALSKRRADAVRDVLIRDGANPDTLVAKGYGSADPISSNDTSEGRLRNRRIEYHILRPP
jgi:outer membrane protein OmpA-like peptidoglycan-associated protein